MCESRANIIVVVEDDAGLNRAVVRLLQAAGFQSFSFDSAEGLLASNVATFADCFVLDVHLPGISGTELRAKLTEAGLSKPVIFITAHDDNETRQSTSSAITCLTKPFNGRMLIQVINAALAAAPRKKSS
jgi:FixJ family two-component response regulator